MEAERQEFADFEWDESKRKANSEKHHIDFLEAAEALFEPRLDIRSDRNGEVRYTSICCSGTRLIVVVFTMRGENCRIISARAARKNETKQYRTLFGG